MSRTTRIAIITAVVTALVVGTAAYLIGEARQSEAVQVLRSENEELRNRIAELEAEPSGPGAQVGANLLRVYGPDDRLDPRYMEVDFLVPVSQNAPVMEKLQLLVDKLSEFKFGGLPIEVLRIERRNEDQIAVINLKESPNAGISWRTSYFQGSTGGGITQETLVRTLLQREYPGEWVDGVQFYYERKPIQEDDWDHVNLSGVFSRSTSLASLSPSSVCACFVSRS